MLEHKKVTAGYVAEPVLEQVDIAFDRYSLVVRGRRLTTCSSCSLARRSGSPFKAGSLSGGEQQMLAVSRALIGGPTVLMLDEPSMGLAPELVDQLFDVFRGLAAGGRTVILAEQNVLEATRIAEHCHLISDRHIAYSGPSGTVDEPRAVQARYSQLRALDAAGSSEGHAA